MLRSPLSRSLTCRYYSKTPWWNIEPSLHDKNFKGNYETGSVKRHGQDGQNSLPTPLPSEKTTETTPAGFQKISTTYNIEMAKAHLREWTERAAIGLRHRADDFTARSTATFSQLGAQLNKVTGYEEIEALKRGVVEQGVLTPFFAVFFLIHVSSSEQRVNASRQIARDAKKTFEKAVIQRADSQREVNDLLQRKSTWTATDVARFTALVPQDHQLQQHEAEAKAVVDGAEEAVEKDFSQLMRLILARYHEEQVWSDKIRSASTYGSLVALGLNMLVFISAILVVEPWKRRRLAQTFEDKIMELSKDNERRLDESEQVLTSRIEQQTALLQDLTVTLLKSLEANAIDGKIGNGDSSQVVIEPVSDVETRRFWLSVIGVGAFTAGLLSSILFK